VSFASTSAIYQMVKGISFAYTRIKRTKENTRTNLCCIQDGGSKLVYHKEKQNKTTPVHIKINKQKQQTKKNKQKCSKISQS
jgi:hypothetical protein